MVCSRAECVFILDNYFLSKKVTAVREAMRILTGKYRIRQYADWLTNFRDTGSVCDRKHVWRRTVLAGKTLRNV
jgi:hypothetical protein